MEENVMDGEAVWNAAGRRMAVTVQPYRQSPGRPGPPFDAWRLVDAGSPLHRVGRHRTAASVPATGSPAGAALRETLATPRMRPERVRMARQRKSAGRGRTARVLMTAGAAVGAIFLIGAMAAPVWAQAYPNKAIRFIVPFAPGGGTDILGRIIGSKFAERFGQPVVIENRAGGGGNVGYDLTARARPDGYTIVINAPGLSLAPSLYKKLSFDPSKDLAPISLVAQGHQVLVINPSLPVKNLKGLVAYAKANPGKLNFGSSGVATAPHLASELFNSLAKIKNVHVPYKGAGPSLIGLMAGEVQMVVMGVPIALPQIEAGKVRALAVLSSTRSPSLPEVPTTKEAGIDHFEAPLWYGILAPAGTPKDIVNRWSAEWIKVAAMPDVIGSIRKAGFEPLSGTPEQFSEFFKADVARWAKVIKEAGIPTLD